MKKENSQSRRTLFHHDLFILRTKLKNPTLEIDGRRGLLEIRVQARPTRISVRGHPRCDRYLQHGVVVVVGLLIITYDPNDQLQSDCVNETPTTDCTPQ